MVQSNSVVKRGGRGGGDTQQCNNKKTRRLPASPPKGKRAEGNTLTLTLSSQFPLSLPLPWASGCRGGFLGGGVSNRPEGRTRTPASSISIAIDRRAFPPPSSSLPHVPIEKCGEEIASVRGHLNETSGFAQVSILNFKWFVDMYQYGLSAK